MERREVNQRQAAELIEMNEVHFSQILNGQRRPGLDTAIKIEEHTGVPVRSWTLSEVSELSDASVVTARKRAK